MNDVYNGFLCSTTNVTKYIDFIQSLEITSNTLKILMTNVLFHGNHYLSVIHDSIILLSCNISTVSAAMDSVFLC